MVGGTIAVGRPASGDDLGGRKSIRTLIVSTAVAVICAGGAFAQEPLKIGLVQSLTGPFNTVGKAVVNGAQLYVQQHGDVVAGRKIQLIVKDDTTAPDKARRIVQELIANDKVAIIGAGITPSALAIAPLVTEAKIPTVVMISGASITVDRSPYIVRTSFTLGQSSAVIADWLVQNGARKIVTLVNDWSPGLESEAVFKEHIPKGSAEDHRIVTDAASQSRFRAVLTKARVILVQIPSSYSLRNQSGIFAKQFLERGMDKSGIRLVGTGDLTDDDELPEYDRCRARHRHRPPLFGTARFGSQQGLSR